MSMTKTATPKAPAKPKTYSFSKRTLDNLVGVHPDLVKVFTRAIQITKQDFMITEGVRSQERQRELYAQGRTKPGKMVTWTLNSNHFKSAKTGYGHAVDVAPYPVDWNSEAKFVAIADAVKQAARELGVRIEWGGDWSAKNRDLPHFQLDRSTYG